MSLEGLNVELVVAGPGVVNTTDGENLAFELDGCTDCSSGRYVGSTSDKSRAAVTAGAGVSGVAGSACS